MGIKLCECGCGHPTTESKFKNGIMNRFISGHNRRSLGKGYSINNGYKRFTLSGSKNIWRYEHVVIMEEYIGRRINKNEVVHHINGDKLDNRLENLQLMTISEHMKLHYHDRVKINGTFAPDNLTLVPYVHGKAMYAGKEFIN